MADRLKKYKEFAATNMALPIMSSMVGHVEGNIEGEGKKMGISKSTSMLSIIPTIQAGGLLIDELSKIEKRKRR